MDDIKEAIEYNNRHRDHRQYNKLGDRYSIRREVTFFIRDNDSGETYQAFHDYFVEEINKKIDNNNRRQRGQKNDF
jgi:hypothetical protein